jgi:hypothetical protein
MWKKVKKYGIIIGSSIAIVLIFLLLRSGIVGRGVRSDRKLADEGERLREDIDSSIGTAESEVRDSIEDNRVAREANKSVRSELEYALTVLRAAKQRSVHNET